MACRKQLFGKESNCLGVVSASSASQARSGQCADGLAAGIPEAGTSSCTPGHNEAAVAGMSEAGTSSSRCMLTPMLTLTASEIATPDAEKKYTHAYDFTRILSSFYFKGYTSLTKIQRIEWNNRGMSSEHAIFITAVSLYLVVSTDLFSDRVKGPITFRNSIISTSAFGVSVGYFITDLAMIFWLYPSLGGMEYVLHHTLSLVAIAYTMLSGEGQFYTYMILISETTTPEINLRWFLDTAGLKKSSAYLVNGILMFVAWLVARIFLFMCVFYHIYLHYSQIMQMHPFGYYLTFVVPSVLFVMNTMWFMKILKGVMKTLAKWP